MSPVQPVNPASQADYYTDLPVGEILRRTRTHYGQTLDDASNYLRIRASQLDAIEKNDLSQLPGQVYAIGYIRTYSEYLGLDGEKMVHLFKQQSGGKAFKPELHFPVPASESKAPNLYIIFGSLAVLALVIGVWIALSAVGRARDKTITEIPNVPADMRVTATSSPPAPVANARLTDTAMKTAALPGIPASQSSAVLNQAASSTESQTTPPSATAIQSQTAMPSAAIAGTTQTAASVPVAAGPENSVPKKEIVITIRDRSWVEVRDKQGKPILSRILKPGEVFIVPEANYGLRLDTGNAGGIELTVNGQAYPPLGKEGDILRGFVLDGNQLTKKQEAPSTH